MADPSGKADSSLDELLLDAGLEPPMANGEIAFDAPWQGRVFGMARALAEQGHYTWDEFRVHLIARIGEWDRSAASESGEEYFYYDHFLAALQALLAEKNMVTPGQVDNRFSELAARPHGHDH